MFSLPPVSIFSALLIVWNNLGFLALICPQYRHFGGPSEEAVSTAHGGLIPGISAFAHSSIKPYDTMPKIRCGCGWTSAAARRRLGEQKSELHLSYLVGA